MNNNQKLKLLAAILFTFILALAGILIYATNFYQKNEKPASSTSAVSSGSSDSAAVSTEIQAGESTTAMEKETITLKLYNYDAMDYDKPKEIVNVEVDKKLYENNLTAAINKVLETTDLSINKAVLDGENITVDLTKEVAAKFNMGSAGGITNTNILAMTVLNLPKVNKLQVTVEGVPNVEGDHFNFKGTFKKSADGTKYELTASGLEPGTFDF